MGNIIDSGEFVHGLIKYLQFSNLALLLLMPAEIINVRVFPFFCRKFSAC